MIKLMIVKFINRAKMIDMINDDIILTLHAEEKLYSFLSCDHDKRFKETAEYKNFVAGTKNANELHRKKHSINKAYKQQAKLARGL